MKARRLFLLAATMTVLAAPAFGQTKAETKLYGKTLAKPSLAAYDKFLKKYPSSVYAEDILARKDTLLNISPYTAEQASGILGGFLPAGSDVKAIAERKEAVDRIYGVCISGDSLAVDRVRIYTLEKGSAGWNLKGSYEAPSADFDKDDASRSFVDSTLVMKIRGVKYIRFNYLVTSGKDQMYVAAYYSPETDEFGYIPFTGTSTLAASSSSERYHIYGRSGESIITGLEKPQMKVLLQSIKQNTSLEEIPEGDYLCDEAIKFWLEKNPDAQGKASKAAFAILQENNALVTTFLSKKHQSSSKYAIAMFDLRGYTVIVCQEKSSGNYVLAWAEPVCKNKKTDQLLNSVSFADANTLDLYYYKGRSFFKRTLNLASKKITR